MYRLSIISVAVVSFSLMGCFCGGTGGNRTPEPVADPKHEPGFKVADGVGGVARGKVEVRGYTTKSGTVVAPHSRGRR